MNDAGPDLATILDSTADLVINDGVDAVTFRAIAHRSGIPEVALSDQFASVEQIFVAMLNREYRAMHASIVDNIDRDPRGGLLSRIYFYILTAVYERPLPRALYVTDPAALNRIMRTVHGMQYQPQAGVRSSFIERMIEIGMARDVDARTVSAMLSAIAAGLAISSPSDDFDRIVKGIEFSLAELVDADVDDTQAGKIAFYEYASTLASDSH